MLFSNNNQVKKIFLNKHKNNIINVTNADGKAEVIIDSYQQSNKLSYKTPTTKINFSFNTVAYFKDLNEDTSIDNLFKKLNSNWNNFWEYNVSSWTAKAGKRFIGTIWFVPFWAEEVKHDHSAKTYRNSEVTNIEKFIKFFLNLINEKLSLWDDSEYSESDKEFVINKINGLFNLLNVSKLKPVLINDNYNLKITEQNFGNISVKKIDSSKLSFKSNNLLPITDYKKEEKCFGPQCSHNLRHLGDVIVTAIRDLVIDILVIMKIL